MSRFCGPLRASIPKFRSSLVKALALLLNVWQGHWVLTINISHSMDFTRPCIFQCHLTANNIPLLKFGCPHYSSLLKAEWMSLSTYWLSFFYQCLRDTYRHIEEKTAWIPFITLGITFHAHLNFSKYRTFGLMISSWLCIECK